MQLVPTFNIKEQEKCRTSEDLFEVLYKKFKPQHYKPVTITAMLQIKRQESESAEEWMGQL